jgi:hypothetical protein
MLSNAVRFLMVSAAASLVALGSAPADACSLISDGALDFIASGAPTGTGAVFFTEIQKQEFWSDPDPAVDAVNDANNIAFYWGSTSPSSEKYYTEFTKPGSTLISLVSNAGSIAAGDVLVVNKTSSYGGHTMIATGPAVQLTTALTPTAPNTLQWALPIADSTTSVHGCSNIYKDSRWSGTCTNFTSGPGTGYIRLYTDLSGNLVGHSWSVTSGSTAYWFTGTGARPFVVGRLVPAYCPLPTPTP